MNNNEMATFAGGCFWCTEAIFQRLRGVIKVTSGYTGGQIENPKYADVCKGSSGHAEALQIEFDSQIITFKDLLDVFFATHDSTTLNRQGADMGTQYRSAIFYHNEEQKQLSEVKIKTIPNCTTKLASATVFYKAEDYHNNFYNQNKSNNPYCKIIIDPKIKKLMQTFPNAIRV